MKDYAGDFSAALAFAEAARKLAKSASASSTWPTDPMEVLGLTSGVSSSECMALASELELCRGTPPRMGAWLHTGDGRQPTTSMPRILRPAAQCTIVQVKGKL